MDVKAEPTFRIDVFLAGDRAVLRQRCREFCYRNGLCVTVSSADFIYTGGGEAGVRVGLVNYPRFPSTPDELMAKAQALAAELMEAACQHTALVVGDHQTVWLSRRAQNPAAR